MAQRGIDMKSERLRGTSCGRIKSAQFYHYYNEREPREAYEKYLSRPNEAQRQVYETSFEVKLNINNLRGYS